MEHDDFMKKVIIAMAIFLLVFTATMIVCFFITSDVPDSLIAAVFAACLGEGSICGFLKKSKNEIDIDLDAEDANIDEEVEDDADNSVD